MTILWWHWLVLGLLLVLAELAASGGFYIIFFGIAALAVGALAAFDVAGPVWVQLLLFSGISVLTLVVFRERLLRAFQIDPQAPAVDQLAGEVAVAMEDLAPGGVGRVELRGAAWSARNSSSAVIVRGSRSRVIRVEGLMLYVEPEGARS
jgi:inner membrane protein